MVSATRFVCVDYPIIYLPQLRTISAFICLFIRTTKHFFLLSVWFLSIFPRGNRNIVKARSDILPSFQLLIVSAFGQLVLFKFHTLFRFPFSLGSRPRILRKSKGWLGNPATLGDYCSRAGVRWQSFLPLFSF